MTEEQLSALALDLEQTYNALHSVSPIRVQPHLLDTLFVDCDRAFFDDVEIVFKWALDHNATGYLGSSLDYPATDRTVVYIVLKFRE